MSPSLPSIVVYWGHDHQLSYYSVALPRVGEFLEIKGRKFKVTKVTHVMCHEELGLIRVKTKEI